MRFLALLLALALAVAALPVSAQTEIRSTCFCQLGSDPKQFSAEVAVTDANRATLAKLISAGDFDLRKTVKVSGDGCTPADWRKNRLCGSTSVSTTKPDGTRDSKSFENTPVSGTRTLRITNTGNMPRKAGTPPRAIRARRGALGENPGDPDRRPRGVTADPAANRRVHASFRRRPAAAAGRRTS